MREFINEVNHIGTNINQIVHNHNSGIYSEDDKVRLIAYMRKLNTEVNREFERCSRFLAEMMEKYKVQVLRDIAIAIQYEPETWCDDAEGKRLRYEAYARRFMKRFEKAA